MICEICEKEDCEDLFKRSAYNQNKITEWMCLDCYKDQHEEDFYESYD